MILSVRHLKMKANFQKGFRPSLRSGKLRLGTGVNRHSRQGALEDTSNATDICNQESDTEQHCRQENTKSCVIHSDKVIRVDVVRYLLGETLIIVTIDMLYRVAML